MPDARPPDGQPVETREIHGYYPGAVAEERVVGGLGVTLRLYEFGHAEGVVHVPPNAADHAVSLGVAGTARTTCVADGERTEGVTHPGHVGVDPALVAQAWTWDAPHSVFTVYLPDAVLRRVAAEADLDPDRVVLRRHPGSDDPLLRHALAALHARPRAPLDDVYAEATARLVAVHLLRRYADRPLPETPTGRLAPATLRRVLDAVEGRLAEPLSLEDLAREAALSPYHFARAFRTSVGTSPLRYVTARRVERARVLLRSRRYRVGEVAAIVGFADPNHFSRTFRRLTGRTPSDVVRGG